MSRARAIKLLSKVDKWPYWYTVWELHEEEVEMAKMPFDFCDDCGRRFQLAELKNFLCEECAPPPNWRAGEPPDDDYDCVTKRKDDEE